MCGVKLSCVFINVGCRQWLERDPTDPSGLIQMREIYDSLALCIKGD